MKKVLLLATFLVSFSTFSQNLTSSQLLDLCDKSLGEVEEFLTANNWYFYQAAEETEEKYGNAKFVFDRPEFKMTDTAYFFSTYYYSHLNSAMAFELFFKDRKVYESYVEQLKNLNFKLTSSTTKGGNIIKVFKNGGKRVEVTIPPNSEEVNGFKFLFAKKSSYKKIRS